MKLVYYNADGTIRGIEDADYITKNTIVKTIVLDYPDNQLLEGLDVTTDPPTPILKDRPVVESLLEELTKKIEEMEAIQSTQDDAITDIAESVYNSNIEERVATLEASQEDQDEALTEISNAVYADAE